ncbi:metalloproteinase inhibitor 2-like [Syngnathus scovelli]|uniref:metalloproteinase inhibitor 2-like n=1 Tax=Syngnathus scovelli TaxID=161590 RepID=UPI0021106861|nr:metalloproteinase inhibitor 2-like [Syngnathus scovelli]
MSWKNFVLPLLLLTLWGLQDEGAQACSCFPIHPQQLYCQSNVVVIKVKVIGVSPSEQGGVQPKKYAIKHMKTFKGAERHFVSLLTGPNSAACGASLTKGVEYVLMARLHSDGSLHISLCDFYHPWDSLSPAQKNLLYRYGEGCDCEIKPCYSYPCCNTKPTECLWTDFLPGKMSSHEQARNYACLKTSDGCCDWCKGTTTMRQYK